MLQLNTDSNTALGDMCQILTLQTHLCCQLRKQVPAGVTGVGCAMRDAGSNLLIKPLTPQQPIRSPYHPTPAWMSVTSFISCRLLGGIDKG